MTDTKRQKVWDEFLKLWPPERVKRMTLPEYTALASPDCFTSCLASKTQDLGSIRRGSAFKFGIYRRAGDDGQRSDAKYVFGTEYAWRAKLGATPEEAFARVKEEVVRIIDAIRAADLQAINSEILWPLVAWKIAFLYQDQRQPLVVGVFKPAWIKNYLGLPASAKLNMAELNRAAMEARGERGILDYSRQIWEGHKRPATPVAPVPAERIPLNCILYGPPGTGKTHATISRALEIFRQAGMAIGKDPQEEREWFERLCHQRRIRFVTFHQSFSYEDFVEGIRPVLEDGVMQYKLKRGVFRRLCRDANRALARQRTEHSSAGSTVWKMSLGNTRKDEAWVFEECKKNNYLLMGYGGDVDFTACHIEPDFRAVFRNELPEQLANNPKSVSKLFAFVRKMQPGDLVVISEGNEKFRAIGKVLGNYRVIERDRDNYLQCRDVEWLYFPNPARPVTDIYSKKFTQVTLYELTGGDIKREALEALLRSVSGPQSLPYVLIIDEINRGNLAAIFGELITLIEETHRSDGSDPLSVALPYSRIRFSVPGNVYIIGTMNTADRSLTRLDTALRRRFSMVEMPPKPELLEKILIPGTSVSVGAMLTRINERITVLLDRDHCIGHAEFMKLKSVPSTKVLEELQKIFLGYVLPLLEEYFYDDWRKIQLVLNDQRKPSREQMLRRSKGATELFGEENLSEGNDFWSWNEAALSEPLSYAHIVDAGYLPQPDAGPSLAGDGGATA